MLTLFPYKRGSEHFCLLAFTKSFQKWPVQRWSCKVERISSSERTNALKQNPTHCGNKQYIKKPEIVNNRHVLSEGPFQSSEATSKSNCKEVEATLTATLMTYPKNIERIWHRSRVRLHGGGGKILPYVQSFLQSEGAHLLYKKKPCLVAVYFTSFFERWLVQLIGACRGKNMKCRTEAIHFLKQACLCRTLNFDSSQSRELISEFCHSTKGCPKALIENCTHVWH